MITLDSYCSDSKTDFEETEIVNIDSYEESFYTDLI